ncbi:hypothetical protein Pmani_034325, partial [Petrolisthes manimaculis]
SLWSLVEGSEQMSHLTTACPPNLVEYWRCVNHTLKSVSEGRGWWGRPCCRLAVSPACQLTCLRPHQPPQLAPPCRPSHEVDFFACVRRTEAGAACCARTQSYKCRTSCEDLFAARTPTRPLRRRLGRDCHAHGHVARCAHALTHTTPAHRPERNLHCCTSSTSASCRSACRSGLTSGAPQQDILDKLEHACGPVNLASELWQCLLRQSEASGNNNMAQIGDGPELGVDAGRAGCCSRATSRACGELCWRAYSKAWGGRAWDALHASCLTRPAESNLAACLGEAEAPCRMGCSGITFCASFASSPTTLFRSCTSHADTAAREDLQLWQDSLRLTLPGLPATLPLLSVTHCLPEVWKAAVCALHLKPCHPTSLSSALCWQDCLHLLSRCVVESEGGLTAGQVCGELSPPPGNPCVSLAPFLDPPQQSKGGMSVSPPYHHHHHQSEPPWRTPTSPCRGAPCPPSHLCSVAPECPPGAPCRPYTCTPACVLGEASSVSIPRGAFLTLPPRGGDGSGCGRICVCGRGGVIGECRAAPCLQPAPCWLGTSNFQHDTELMVGCDICACHAGELTCLTHTCPASHLTPPTNPGLAAGLVSKGFPGFGVSENQESSSGGGVGVFSDKLTGLVVVEGLLPCGCVAQWLPVCANNGRTFPSECLARCAGLTEGEWREGECGGGGGGGERVCEGVRCGRGRECVPLPSTCLTLPSTPCPQHTCVAVDGECRGEGTVTACDSTGRQYSTLCNLVRAGATLAYLGPCNSRCSPTGVVCGRDGRTWASECQAHAHRVPVDYRGPCRGVGVGMGVDRCANVTCPKPSHQQSTCVGVVDEPGWCCGGVCGGGVRVAWSVRAVEVAAVALPAHHALTVHALLDAFAREVQVSECGVSGHITLHGHLLVLITPIPTPTPPLIAEACVVEAERLVGVVRARSPRLMATLPASTLILALPAHQNSAG